MVSVKVKDYTYFMKATIKAVVLFVVTLVVSWSCTKDNWSETPSVIGEWKLESYFGQDAAESSADVYVSFTVDMNFICWQRLGSGHYRMFSGKYSISDGILSGNYGENRPWGGSYSSSLSGDRLSLVLVGGDATPSVYVRTTIPDTVKKDAEDYGAD